MNIPHALFRNTLIPLFMVIYLIDENTEIRFDQFFKWMSFLTLLAIPVFLFSLLFGVNLFTLLVFPSWTSWISPLQYLIFMSLIYRRVHDVTANSPFSYCLSVVSASAAGYLYEVPRWIIRDGIFGIYREARMSFFIIDSGMLAVPFLFYMLRDKKIKNTKALLLSGLIYLAYTVMYTPLSVFYLQGIYPFIRIPLTVLCRVPAMFLIYQMRPQ